MEGYPQFLRCKGQTEGNSAHTCVETYITESLMTTSLAEIHEIADRLLAEGTEPSVRAVAKVLGVQNTGLIGAGLNEWRARNAALAEATEMPDAFREQLELFGVAVLRSAKEEGEVQARVLADEIRRLHRSAAEREAELLAQAVAREDEMKAEMAEKKRGWEEERAALIAEMDEFRKREQVLTDKVTSLEANWDLADSRASIAEVARTKAESSRDATEALFADLTQTAKAEAGKMEAERDDWQQRAIAAERKVAVSEQLLREANKRIDDDARRIDGLVSDIVQIAGSKMPAERRNEPPPAQA